MAKDKAKEKSKDKPAKKDKAEKAEKAEAPTFKYGVSDLAEKLDLKEASVRVKLRKNNVDKAGKSYGWNSKSDFDEVVATLKADKSEEKADKKADKKDGKKDKKKKSKD